MSKTRHIFFSQTATFSKTPGAGNPPEANFFVGCVNIPKNRLYSIKNFSITQSDSLITGSGSSFNSFVVFHRFFGTDDPIRDIINSLPSGYTLLFNGAAYTGGFSFQDQNDSQGVGYNNVIIRNTNSGQNTLTLLDVKTSTKHETIPITINPFFKDLKDFYFDSGTNNFLAFCIFPFLNFNAPTNPLVFSVDYTINFDLIEG
jgi:hypothetical protein